MLAEPPMIEFVEEAHEIVGDPPAGRMPADDLALHAVVRPPPARDGNRQKSSRAAGLGSVTVRFGNGTSSKLPTSIDQNEEPQASLSCSGD